MNSAPPKDTIRYEPIEGTKMPAPAPGMRWTGRFKATSGKGKSWTVTQTINAAANYSKLTVGTCTYRALALDLVYAPDVKSEGSRASAISLLPDLGVVVLTASGPVGKPYDDFQRAVSISVTRPVLKEDPKKK